MPRHSSRALWTAKLTGQAVAGGGGSRARQALEALADGAVRPKFAGVVLGIDPSLRGTGLALLAVDGAGMRLLFSRTVRLRPVLTVAECLGEIYREVGEALAREAVRHVALEQIIYVQNTRIALTLGAARGAAMAAAAGRELEVFEYPPRRVKQAVIGFGGAAKEQIARMVAQHLHAAQALPLDEADAAAVALCHAFTWRG